jgi:hypothetical protein
MKKKNTLAPNRKGKVIAAAVVIGLVALALAVWGIRVAYGKLAAVCERQCCVTDSGEQVEVISGKIVPAQLIVSHFGLTNGVNLAQVPFDTLRERLLKDMPNLKDVKISNRLKTHMNVEETERVQEKQVIK